mgnify:CR=1 FL=1
MSDGVCPLCGGTPICVACGLDRDCHEHFHRLAMERANPIRVEREETER